MKRIGSKQKPKKYNISRIAKHPLFVGISTLILGSLLTIAFNLWQSNTQIRISANGSYYPIEIPPVLFDSQKNYQNSISSDSIEKEVPETKRRDGSLDSTSFSLYKYLSGLEINSVVSDLKYIHGYWIFKIENKGSKKISDIALFVPFDGYFELTQNGTDKIITGKFDKNIEIGEIKPSNIVTIKIWSDRSALIISRKPYFSSLQDKPKVTFENGYRLVNFVKN